MKTITRILAAAALVLAVAACAKDMEYENSGPRMGKRDYIASFNPETKTAISGTGKTRQVSWSAGDEIIYYSTEGGSASNKVTIPDDCTEALLSLDVDFNSDFINAAYGATQVLQCRADSMILRGVIKAEQDGQFPTAHASVAHAGLFDESLTFKNITGLICFNIAESNVDHILFSGNNGEIINGSGAVKVKFDASGTPSVYPAGSAGTSIRVDINKTAGQYWIAIIPTMFSNGFTIRFFDENDLRIGMASTSNPMNVTRNDIYNLGDIVSKIAPEPFELSCAQTANCYIVPASNTEYKFRADVMGNDLNATFGSTPVSASVLWESRSINGSTSIYTGSVVSNVRYIDGYVYFSSGDYGSALVAVKDASGAILWSWHLWVWPNYSESANSQVYKKGAGTAMDRDLGADGAYPASNVDKRVYGLLYQWGRKDPFFYNTARKSVGQPLSTTTTNATVGTVEWATQYPTSYILHASNSSKDWHYSHDPSLWGPEKTMYDPCPPGWRIPDYDFWYVVSGFANHGYDDATMWSASALGLDFRSKWANYTHVFYPASGYFDGTSTYSPTGSDLRYDTTFGFWWCNLGSTNAKSYFLSLNCDQKYQQTYTSSQVRSCGYSVRCVKDGTPTPFENGSGGGGVVIKKDVESVSLNEHEVTIGVGETFQLEVTVTPEDADDLSVEWLPDNDAIVSVDKDGLVTGLCADDTGVTITVRSVNNPNATDQCIVYVTEEVSQSKNDLSAEGTSNCYIVSAPGEYHFKATVMGNSAETINPLSAKLLWQTQGTADYNADEPVLTASSVRLEDGNIYFTVPDPMTNGNAVIAAYSDANKTNILWTWHIWICKGYDPVATAHDYNNNAGTVMDRNVGALVATENVLSFGLLYQWGRKDPFPGSAYINQSGVPAQTSTTGWSNLTISATTGNVDYVTKHPMHFIMGADNWMYTADNSLWSGTSKTKYDPCPQGWRIASGGTNGLWAKALGGNTATNPHSGYGCTFDGNLASGKKVWYPFTGYKIGKSTNQGSIAGVTGFGRYWSGTSYSGERAYIFSIVDTNTTVSAATNYFKSFAFPVRCVKE